MKDIPWNDTAVLLLRSEHDAAERDIVAEGNLRDVVDRIAASKVGDIPRLIISLPDRRAQPFRYDGTAIHELVRARRAERAALLPVPPSSASRRRRATQRPSPAA
ncbi:MAG: hypothetical protein JWM65_64 [Sphingomonas bacterium]|nr:hypothetical protein [Sphingomonas bacterium]